MKSIKLSNLKSISDENLKGFLHSIRISALCVNYKCAKLSITFHNIGNGRITLKSQRYLLENNAAGQLCIVLIIVGPRLFGTPQYI